MTNARKTLIINADDFGFTRDVNAGIVHAHKEGVLTATTLMANGNAFEDAVRLARDNPDLDVGCHLVLIQGQSVLNGFELPRKLTGVVAAVASGRIDPYSEFRAQISKIVAAGIKPSHIDTHKHTHILPPVYRAAIRLASEFGVPYVRVPVPAANRAVRRAYERFAGRGSVRMTDHFAGFRLTGSLTEDTLALAIEQLQDGLTEFMCHPGFLGPELERAETRLKQSRFLELQALISPRIRDRLNRGDIQLSNFRAFSSSASV